MEMQTSTITNSLLSAIGEVNVDLGGSGLKLELQPLTGVYATESWRLRLRGSPRDRSERVWADLRNERAGLVVILHQETGEASWPGVSLEGCSSGAAYDLVAALAERLSSEPAGAAAT